MKKVKLIFTTLMFLSLIQTYGQHIGMTFKDGESIGITNDSLEHIYKSAVHSDTSLAIFKTDAEQEAMGNAWQKILQDLANFLKKNNFVWDKPTRCFHKFYFNSDGTIDYVLYNFITKDVKPENLLSVEKQTEYNRLLNLFIKDYKFPMTAKVKFGQCGSITFTPKK